MGRYCSDNNVLLAPHGKTTMAPALWKLQFEHRTWALTVALPHQAVTAHRFGVRRILLANEAADPRSLESLVRLAGQPDVEVYSFVDSVAVVRAYRAAIDSTGVEPTGLRFLIDIGVPNGRTGCRSQDEAEAVAREIGQTGTAVVGGIGAYEGPAGEDRSPESLASVNAYLESVTGIFRDFHRNGVFDTTEPPVLTIGGSEIFEIVSEHIRHELASIDSYRLVLRSGCYLVHDHGHYAAMGPSIQPGWAYTPFQGALEVGATVVSRPQIDLALLNVGRRDIGFDEGLPSVIDPLPTGGGRSVPHRRAERPACLCTAGQPCRPPRGDTGPGGHIASLHHPRQVAGPARRRRRLQHRRHRNDHLLSRGPVARDPQKSRPGPGTWQPMSQGSRTKPEATPLLGRHGAPPTASAPS